MDPIRTGNRLVDFFIEQVRQRFNFLATIPILDGRLIEAVEFAGLIPLNIEHGLGRPYKGWFVTNVYFPGSSSAFYTELGNPDTSIYVRMNVSFACVASIWVF